MPESISPKFDAGKESDTENRAFEHLSKSIDKDTTIFAYGYLLDEKNLKDLLKNRGEFTVHIATTLEEASRLSAEKPKDIIIVKGVTLEGIRASIATEAQLRKLYEEQGQSTAALVKEGLLEPNPRPNSYLYARVANKGERGRFLNGGLIVGLTEQELAMLDRYELEPVYKRQKTPKLEIDGRTFKPDHITFYAGNIGKLERTEEEILDAKKTSKAGRDKIGEYGPNAKWPRQARHNKQ